MDALVERPGGKRLARARSPKKGNGLTLINQTVEDYAEAIATAGWCCREMQRNDLPHYFGDAGPVEAKARLLESAKAVHSAWLGRFAAADGAFSQLIQIGISGPRFPLTHATATAMLTMLFGALSKKKADDENAAMLLAACADMFNPLNDVIGTASGLWTPVSNHPVVLALAIKRLIATSVFTPSPSELREAMREVKDKLGVLVSWTSQWLNVAEIADAIVFTFDRAAWDAAYARIDRDGEIALAVQCRLHGEDGSDEDDDGNPIPPSPRWEALNQRYKDRERAEAEAENAARAAAAAAMETNSGSGGE